MEYNRELVLKLYEKMLLIRTCEESLVDPIIDKKITCPVHLCTGQEAVPVGICEHLLNNDFIFGNHRSHGHYLAKGGDLKKLIFEVFCRAEGCSHGRGGSMHIIDKDIGMLGSAPIVGGTISLAVGAALHQKNRNMGGVAVSFFGDGATNEGVLYESMNFAALKKLPIIFACENNLYATHMPIDECRPNRDIAKSGEQFGIPAYKIDGNDVLAVYEIGKLAIERCRRGEGPVFIEFLTYRLRGHVGPDDNIQGMHTDIRSIEELSFWKSKDPIRKIESHLLDNSIVDESDLVQTRKEIQSRVLKIIDYAMNSERPQKSQKELTQYVFK